MSNTSVQQLSQIVFAFQPNSTKITTTSRNVRQDKSATGRARIASVQPERYAKGGRAQAVCVSGKRPDRAVAANTKLVPMTLWVKSVVKDDIRKKAARESRGGKKGLSPSAIGAAFLEKALQEDHDMQYGAMLVPIIEKAIEKQMWLIRDQLRWLLMRVAFDSNQTRSLVTNIFSRQPGIDKETREFILTRTAEAAKANIFGKSQQLKELVEEADKILRDKEYSRYYASQ